MHQPDGDRLRTALDDLTDAFIDAADLAGNSRDVGVVFGVLACLVLLLPMAVVAVLLGARFAVHSALRAGAGRHPRGATSTPRADAAAVAEGIVARARANERAHDRARWAEREGMPASAEVWRQLAENDRGESVA